LGLLDRLFRVFGDVRAGESGTVLLLFVDLFLLLCGYYILKTVREPLILVSAEQDLQVLLESDLPTWLVDVLRLQKGAQLKAVGGACQALLLVGFIPLYSWFASRVRRQYLLVGVTGFFIANLVLFYVASLSGVLFLGFYFYVWVGIFNLAMIAQFWGFCNDIYSRGIGERVFPIIVIGQTAGAPLGAKIAKWFSDWPAFQLVVLTAGILVVYLAISLIVHFREIQRRQTEDDLPETKEQPLEKGGGFALVFRNPYILLLAFLFVLLNIVNTSGEFILSALVKESSSLLEKASQGAFIQEFYGDFYFWVNITAFLLQALLVSRIVKHTGIRGVVLILPVVSFFTYGLIGLGAGLVATRWMKTAENSSDYSIMNTARAMLWLPTSRDEKYKAKQAVDTFFVRIGDMTAAIFFLVGTTALGLGVQALAGFNLIVIAVWFIVCLIVLKHYRRLAQQVNGSPR